MADTESMNTENSGSDVQEAKWYVAHTYSGYENKVKVNLEKTIANMHLEDTILEVRIPVQEVVETTGTDEGEADKIEYTEEGERKPQKKKKAPKQKLVKRKLFPGYVFVHMILMITGTLSEIPEASRDSSEQIRQSRSRLQRARW